MAKKKHSYDHDLLREKLARFLIMRDSQVIMNTESVPSWKEYPQALQEEYYTLADEVIKMLDDPKTIIDGAVDGTKE